jgi:hypothetical protein
MGPRLASLRRRSAVSGESNQSDAFLRRQVRGQSRAFRVADRQHIARQGIGRRGFVDVWKL